MSIRINIFFSTYIIILIFKLSLSQIIILNPPSLGSKFANKTINIEYGKVGLLTDFYIRGQIILETITSSRDACSSLTGLDLRKNNTSAYDENYKILLAYKGSCTISQKARNAQNIGASMLLLINKGNILFNNIIFPEFGNDINIPVGTIDISDGKNLEDVSLDMPKVDFQNCSNKIKES